MITQSRKRILIANDAHCEMDQSGNVEYLNCTLHGFLAQSQKFDVAFSSPCVNAKSIKSMQSRDSLTILPRRPYFTTWRFYLLLPYFAVSYFLHFLRESKKADAIVVLVPSCSAPIVWLAAKLARKPVIMYVVGDIVEVISVSAKYGALGLAARLAARMEWGITKILCRSNVSYVLGEALWNKLHVPGLPVYCGVSTLIRQADILPGKRLDSRAHSRLRLLCVTRISHEKGLEYLLEAVKLLCSASVPLQSVDLVGGGPLLDHLRKMAETLGISEIVAFRGQLPFETLLAVYDEADIFILPSLSEGVPKVILEAMARGLPIVATDVGGIPYLLGKGERGWLVPPRDPVALANAIEMCSRDDRVREMRQSAAFEFVCEQSIEKQIARVDAVIASALGETPFMEVEQ